MSPTLCRGQRCLGTDLTRKQESKGVGQIDRKWSPSGEGGQAFLVLEIVGHHLS